MMDFIRAIAEAAELIALAIKDRPEVEDAARECFERLRLEWGPQWAGVGKGFRTDQALAWAASIVYNILMNLREECARRGGSQGDCNLLATAWLGGLQQFVASALLASKTGKKDRDGEAMFM